MATLTDKERTRIKRMWPNITDSMIEEYRDSFAVFDVDGDGQITPEEVQITMKSMGIAKTLTQIRQMMARVDHDKNGVIDFIEFVGLMQMQRDETKEFKRAFDIFDQDKNGLISPEEVNAVFSNLGHAMTEEEIRFLFSAIDANGDGQIDFEEFQNMMKFGPPQIQRDC